MSAVRVAVDQTRQDGHSGGVYDTVRLPFFDERGRGTDIGDAIAANGYRPSLDDPSRPVDGNHGAILNQDRGAFLWHGTLLRSSARGQSGQSLIRTISFAGWEAFDLRLEEQCRRRQGDILRGHRETIGERLVRDMEAMSAPPAAPFEACAQAPGQVSSQSLVRYETNDYSVPVAYGHRDVWVRGYVDRVVIGCGGEVIARHPRSYEREDTIFEPIHYLPLIERKIGALDQAAPLAGWDLPPAFQTLRRLMEARSGRAGRREYVQVLRLLESFGLEDLHGAVKDALRLGAIGFDAVKHLVLCRLEKRPPKLDLDVYPYLPKATVGRTSAVSYMCLLSEDAA